jgi:hypothetical protein
MKGTTKDHNVIKLLRKEKERKKDRTMFEIIY